MLGAPRTARPRSATSRSVQGSRRLARGAGSAAVAGRLSAQGVDDPAQIIPLDETSLRRSGVRAGGAWGDPSGPGGFNVLAVAGSRENRRHDSAGESSREPRPMHFKRIDQLRGVAALAVVLCHAAVSAETVVVDPSHQSWHWASWLLGWGYLGVPLFFVISGLCIHLPTASALAAGRSARPDWQRFFQRRFWRLYPPYLAALVLAGGLLLVIRGELPVGWRGVLAQVFLVHTFSPTTFDGLNPPAWTLAVETQLYLAYPARLGALRAPRGLARARRRAAGDHALSHQPELRLGSRTLRRRGVGDFPGALVRMGPGCPGGALGGRPRDDAASGTDAPGIAALVLALAVRAEWEMWRPGWYTFKEPLYGVAFALVVVVTLDRERAGKPTASHRDRPPPRRRRRLLVQSLSPAPPDPVCLRAVGAAVGGRGVPRPPAAHGESAPHDRDHAVSADGSAHLPSLLRGPMRGDRPAGRHRDAVAYRRPSIGQARRLRSHGP